MSPRASLVKCLNTLTDQSLVVTFDDNQNNRARRLRRVRNPDIVSANGTIALSGMATDPDAVPDTLAPPMDGEPEHRNLQRAHVPQHQLDGPGPADNDREIVFTLTATEPDENRSRAPHPSTQRYAATAPRSSRHPATK